MNDSTRRRHPPTPSALARSIAALRHGMRDLRREQRAMKREQQKQGVKLNRLSRDRDIGVRALAMISEVRMHIAEVRTIKLALIKHTNEHFDKLRHDLNLPPSYVETVPGKTVPATHDAASFRRKVR
jgi:hypothetical protein